MSRETWFTRPIYWLLILALVLSLALAAPVGSKVSADPSEVWVDDDNCPGPGSGTEADPYCKIQEGIDAVAQPGTVHVAAGNYTENITLSDKVQVLGAGAAVTTIHGDGTDSVVKATGGVGASTKLDGFTVTNGTAPLGGGIYISYSQPTVSNCDFSNNSADGNGGGMYILYYRPTVTNCTFEGNSATDAGGGMYNYQSSPTVTNCTFEGNSASRGGGMYNYWKSSPRVTNCIFDGNSATGTSYGLGGGMNNEDSSPKVTNCIFNGNSAPNGGGMFNSYDSPTVTNCIFSGNSAGDVGGGMYNYQSSPTVTNCILVNNSADNKGGGIYAWLSSPTIDYNDLWNNPPNDYEGCSPGPNDISVDPMFVNPSAEDFHLMLGSPCIDAGTNDGAPSKDMDGNLRPIDGDWDGTATADMGAYEYLLASVEFSATPRTGPTPLEVQFSDETPGDIDTWNWDFGDGGTSNEQNPSHIYTLPGPFTVSLIVSGPSRGGTETKVDYIWPYTQGVGGEAYPVNRLAILAPWFALAALLLGGTGWLVLRRRRAES